MESCMYCVRQFQVNRWLIFWQVICWKLRNGRNGKFKSSQDLAYKNREKVFVDRGKYLFICDTNLPPIFHWFSIHLPQSQRSYAACSDFSWKKLKNFVTWTWHNRVMGCFVCGIAWRGRMMGWGNKHFIWWYIVSNKMLIMRCSDSIL